jgi:hypothetical protein
MLRAGDADGAIEWLDECGMDKRRCLLGLAAKVRDHQAAIERRMAEEMAEVLKPAKPRAAQTSAPPAATRPPAPPVPAILS